MRATITGMLCVSLLELPVAAELAPGVGFPGKPRHPVQLQGDARVLHALNRFTFGPRPGEIAEVRRMGLDRWFTQQLNPQTIDDAALESRLAAFPAMSLPQGELFQRYPSAQMIRVIAKQGFPLPSDPIEHAIYADGIARYEQVQIKKAAGGDTPGAAGAATVKTDGNATAGAVAPDASKDTEADKRRKGAGRVNLLAGDDGPAYTMAGGKKKPSSSAASTDAAAIGAAVPQNDRSQHKERAFPEAETVTILALPPEARVRRIASMEPEQLGAFRRSLSQAEITAFQQGLTAQQKETLAALEGTERMIGAELLQTRLERDLYSNRQLEAVMTDFWLNHFNVYLRKNQNEPYYLPAYERDTIRPRALGRFEDLLDATAKSPAMLEYLDNAESIGPDSQAANRNERLALFGKRPQGKPAAKDRGLNENYARELMELHTLGVRCEVSKDHTVAELDPACGRGYTQADVTEVAKVFSGWTVERPVQGGTFFFDERRHEPGKKSVLGTTIPEGGEKEGFAVLHMLATSPATARLICTQLAVRFVSDAPPTALVDRMAKSYLASDGDIRTVLLTLFHSPEFWSPAVERAKIKTPLEFVTSAVRATDADVTNGLPLVQSLDRLGMPLYGMQTPNGYSWKSEDWVSTGALVSRLNFALVLSGDRLQGVRTDGALLAQAPTGSAENVALNTQGVNATEDAEERRLEILLVGMPVSERTREAVVQQSENSGAPEQAQRDFLPQSTQLSPRELPSAIQQERVMAGLLLGSPEFQRR